MALIRTLFNHEKKEAVERIFEEGTQQAEVLYALYALVIPDFSRMVKYQGWPKGGKSINAWIGQQFMAFDAKHHPKVMPGGLWMNAGFSSLGTQHLDAWEVEVNTDEIVYAEPDSKLMHAP